MVGTRKFSLKFSGRDTVAPRVYDIINDEDNAVGPEACKVGKTEYKRLESIHNFVYYGETRVAIFAPNGSLGRADGVLRRDLSFKQLQKVAFARFLLDNPFQPLRKHCGQNMFAHQNIIF